MCVCRDLTCGLQNLSVSLLGDQATHLPLQNHCFSQPRSRITRWRSNKLCSVSYLGYKMIAWEFLGTLPCVAKNAIKNAMKKRYVVLSSFHTVSSRDRSAMQPRRKERSSAQYMWRRSPDRFEHVNMLDVHLGRVKYNGGLWFINPVDQG